MLRDRLGRPLRPVSLMPASADPGRIERDVRALEGVRHPDAAPAAHGRAEEYVARELGAAGLRVDRPAFEYRGGRHRNVRGILPGRDPEAARVLVGAHYDTVPGSPGADDNASGVAALLETARCVRARRRRSVEFVGFDLEEPQGGVRAHRIGSARYAGSARSRGRRYAGCLVYEMVGYTDPEPGSQRAPWLLFWKRVPRSGTFLAAVGDWKSGRLLRQFSRAARRAASGLEVVRHRTPLRGWLLPVTRLSDHSRFWDAGYPALMLTDTAFLRNPHYHRSSDRAGTLDFGFTARVVDATVATVDELAAG